MLSNFDSAILVTARLLEDRERINVVISEVNTYSNSSNIIHDQIVHKHSSVTSIVIVDLSSLLLNVSKDLFRLQLVNYSGSRPLVIRSDIGVSIKNISTHSQVTIDSEVCVVLGKSFTTQGSLLMNSNLVKVGKHVVVHSEGTIEISANQIDATKGCLVARDRVKLTVTKSIVHDTQNVEGNAVMHFG